MEILIMNEVEKVLESLDPIAQAEVWKSVDLLKEKGHELGMPDAKPIGNKFWELRIRARPSVRIVYAFCHGVPILLVAFTKNKSSIPRALLKRAANYLRIICT